MADVQKQSMITPGDLVLLKSYKEVHGQEASEVDYDEHFFEVHEVYEDCIGGIAINGLLQGQYGEPEFNHIKLVYKKIKSESLSSPTVVDQ